MKKINMSEILTKYWLLIFTVAFAVVIGIIEPAFMRIGNVSSMFSTACLTAIAAAGLVCVQAIGEMDFSTGAIMSWSASMICVLLNFGHVKSYVLAFIISILSCVLLGGFNAFCHVVLGIPAFLATLASANVFRAFTLIITDNTTIYKGKWDSNVFTYLGQTKLFGFIPMPFVVFLIIAIIMIFLLERTKLGKCLYAVGGNPRACEYVGINQKTYKVIAFVICALLCGVSGVLQASVANGGGAASGDAYQFQTILVCALGATFIKKGISNIPGAFLGSLLLTMIANAIIMIGLPNFYQYAAQGIVLVAAVLISVRIRAKNERS